MNWAKIKLATVSPISWGGYDRNADSLVVRIPSIRGTLRKWYRWYLASLECREPDLGKIWDGDSDVFGTVHGKEPKKSRVALKFKVDGKPTERIMTAKDPFLWALRRNQRKFYENLKFELIALAEDNKSLTEFAKAISLNVALGGFGYRSNRGYGSLTLVGFDSSSQEVKSIFSRLKKVSNAINPVDWLREVGELMKLIGINPCERISLWNIQNLSNGYLLYLSGCSGWRNCLIGLERRLKMVERDLRITRGRSKDYRVLLGSPIIDPRKRRPLCWRERRASPLILGLGGRGYYVRGILLPSTDYPKQVFTHDHGEATAHFRSKEELAQAFEKIVRTLEKYDFFITNISEVII